MFSTLKDGNRVPIWYGLSSVDGTTPIEIKINSSNGKVKMEIGTSVSAVIANLKLNAVKDDNRISVLSGISNADSSVFIPVSVNPVTGAILASI